MKNKLLKPVIISMMALALVACDDTKPQTSEITEAEAVASEGASEDMNVENKASDNKPASDDQDAKAPTEDTDKDDENIKKETIEVKKNDMKKEDKNTDKKADAPAKAKEKTKYEDALTEDGKYSTSLIASLKGKGDDYITATSYAAKIEDDKLIISGSFDYYKDPSDYENAKEIENKEDQKFVINDDTVFEAVGGMAPAKEMTRDEFVKYFEEVKESGLALIIFVENGVAKSVSISS